MPNWKTEGFLVEIGLCILMKSFMAFYRIATSNMLF